MKTMIIPDVRQHSLEGLTLDHRFGSLFSSQAWMTAVALGYDLTISASVRIEGSRIVDAIPFAHVADLRGERVVCIPFSDYCDPLVTNAEVWSALIEPILALELPVSLRCLHNPMPPSDRRFSETGRAMWHAVDLKRPEEEVWAGLASSARQNIRKARRNGIVVREGKSLDDVRLFHDMHSSLRKSKYRLLAQPFAFFEEIHAAFAADDRLTVLLAEVEDRPIAGIFLLEHAGILYYKFNASIDQRFRPNDLLAWHALLVGQRNGLDKLDFGLSDVDQPGLIRYKEKFATEKNEISIIKHQPEGFVDSRGDQAGRLLRDVTTWMTDPEVPDELTRKAGDALYRFFC
ncbi:MAG: lipid II:glycine glycyltransferase FemX [Geminicoccaceae bacterium]